MPKADIDQIHLSLVRTFQYYKHDISKEKPFGFLVNDKEYYDKVIEKELELRSKGIIIPGLGLVRSVLDPPNPKIHKDSFFSRFPEYYRIKEPETGILGRLLSLFSGEPDMNVVLNHHYPCAIDAVPSEQSEYRVDISSLPGSLKTTKDAKMSVSLRIYPVGLASLRLGWYFSTESSYMIEDIINFLKEKSSIIEIRDNPSEKWKKFQVDELCKEYSLSLIHHFHGDALHSLPNWEFTHSIIDIVGPSNLTSENNFDDIFLPLMCFDPEPWAKKERIEKLSWSSREEFYAGPRSFLIYMPTSSYYDRRKLRRWLRNIIELYSIQDYMIGKLEKIKTTIDFSTLLSRHWIKKIQKGIFPPNINELYAIFNYQNLHLRPAPLKAAWSNRYNRILKVLDRKNRINQSKNDAEKLLLKIVDESEKASKEAGEMLMKMLESLKTGSKIISGLG